MNKALVLSSGGIDSTTCVGIAINQYGKENVSTVSFYYGQKHSKELDCANRIAEYYRLPHYVLDISKILEHSNCSLLSHSTEEVADGTYSDQLHDSQSNIVSTYVPFRNGLILSSAAALALSIYPEDTVHIYIGAHADDAAGSAYADCSKEFTDTMAKAVSLGTYNKVIVEAPLVEMNKAHVVYTGLMLSVPYYHTWSCYKGGDNACGKCATCIDRIKAFKANKTKDPINYEGEIEW
jgi:7-cyano-7-deazaguanine synthase